MAPQLTTALAALLFCTALSAETFAQAYLKPGYVSPVDRQLSHTSDGNGRSLPWWYPMQQPRQPQQSRSLTPKEQEKQEEGRRKTQQTLDTLNTVRFPKVEFTNTPLREVATWLEQQLKVQGDPKNPEIKIRLGQNKPVDDLPITLSLADASPAQVLKSITESQGLKLWVMPSAVVLFKSNFDQQ